METDDLANRWSIRGDPAQLMEAAGVLRGAQAEEIFGSRFPGEYVMVGIARLLDSIAHEMRDNGTLGHEVVSAATALSGHVLTYVPKLEKGQ